jgi:tRNA(adenine34) deaminase
VDEIFMRAAIEEAERAAAAGEVPVGAVVVRERKILSFGRNRREEGKNALAHAELEAISGACAALGGWRLSGCTLYVTLEPCPMCAGAIINARLDRVVFGAYDPKAGSVCSMQEMFTYPYNHRPDWIGGVLEKDCAGLLSEFFRKLRSGR